MNSDNLININTNTIKPSIKLL